MPEENIGVIGISILDGPIGPNGNHLRWSFPVVQGFPLKGFRIFRRESKKLSEKAISFSGLPINVALPDNLNVENVHFLTHPRTGDLHCRESNQERRLYITPSAGAQLELRFSEPVAHVRVELSGSGYGALRAFKGKTLVAQVTSGGSLRELSCAGVSRIILDLGAGEVRSVSFSTNAAICNAGDWVLIKKLSLPVSDQEALKLLEPGLKNYYAASVDSATAHYRRGALDLVSWLQHLLSPTAEFFENPESQPHLLRIRSEGDGPTTATYVQSLFILAALDPNVARMMCLYWVDAYEPATHGPVSPPDRHLSYDYKVEGDWNDGDGRCGLLLNLGQTSALLPFLRPAVTGKQLNGLRWLGGQMRGRLGLRWPRPVLGETPQARATQPVLYQVTRISLDKEQLIDEPVVVNNRAWEAKDPILYIDPDLPRGSYSYKIRPIDLFGQLGLPIQSDKIEVDDNIAPPPPIRTKTFLTPAEAPSRLLVQFEFGAAQHQMAPDVRGFIPYWRSDSLFSRRVVNLSLVATAEGSNGLVHTLRIRNENLTAIPLAEFETFAGDVITNVVTGASQTLPANARRRFRIATTAAPDKVVLEATPQLITNGTYELVRDPHNKNTWATLSNQIQWREPISGVVKSIDTGIPVQVLSVERISPPKDPFADVPANKRPRNFPSVPPAREVIEITVNRVFTEPDVFATGQARKALTNTDLELIYLITGPTDGGTRIALPSDASVSVGDTLELLPAVAMRERVRTLRIGGVVDADRLLIPGGEIAFENVTGADVETSIMRVISSAVNQTGTFEVVVRADDAASISLLRVNQSRVRYYAPFVFGIDVALSENSSAPIAMPIEPTRGHRDGFIALSSIDIRNQEGSLGTPSQFCVISPGPTGAPSTPYPCGMSGSAEAGYASPPNRAGRSSVCVTWDAGTLSPAEGLRYEVERALDNGILAAHFRDWQTGKIRTQLSAPIIVANTVEGTVDQITVDSEKGLIRAKFMSPIHGLEATSFRNGRLIKDGVCYQVTVAQDEGTDFELLLRGPLDPLPGTGTATLESPPDYSGAKENNAVLRSLASDAPDAFAVVTGVPVNTNKFTDDVAGKGRNRFFYRVRAVDAAKNRSDWSPISVPFYQVDTTPPQAPLLIAALGDERKVTLRWLHDELAVVRFAIFRFLQGTTTMTPYGRTPDFVMEIDPALPRIGVFEFQDQSVEGLRADESYVYQIVAIKVVRQGPDVDDFLEIDSEPSLPVQVRALDSLPPDPPNWSSVEWWDASTNSPADVTSSSPVARLTWSTSLRETKCILFRRGANETMWNVVADTLMSNAVVNSQFTYTFFDTSADSSQAYEYEVAIINRLGRKNTRFNIIQLGKLK